MLGNLRSGLSLMGRGIARAAPTVTRDLAGIAAVGSIAYGAWLLHPAAGFIVGGALVLIGVIASSPRQAVAA